MIHYKSSSDLKDLAKETLKGKFGISMLVAPVLHGITAFVFVFPAFFLFFFVYAVILTLETMHNYTTPESSMMVFMGIYFLMIFVCSILIGVLNAGIAYFNLNLACGRPHRVSDLFCGFRHHFKKALALSAIPILVAFVMMLPYLFCCIMWSITSENIWLIGTILSLLLYVIIWIYIQLCWSQCYYLLSDFPKTSAIDLLKLSTRIMKGHKKRLFYIWLSFLPLDFLCACSSNIGQLWCTPYKNMTYTLFFLDMMQPAKAETVESEIVKTIINEPETTVPEMTDAETTEIEEDASELF